LDESVWGLSSYATPTPKEQKFRLATMPLAQPVELPLGLGELAIDEPQSLATWM
jgi:hypothetical protein